MCSRLTQTGRTIAELPGYRLREDVEAAVEEERAIRRVLTASKARELRTANLLEHLGMEADVRLREAEIAARAGRVLTAGLSPLAVRYHAVEARREVMERWDGRTLPRPPFADPRPEAIHAVESGDGGVSAHSDAGPLPPA